MARWILRVVRSVKRPTFVKGLIIGSVVALGLFAVIFKENAPQTHAESWEQNYGADFARWEGLPDDPASIIGQLPQGSVALATFEDRPIQGSAAFDSIDPKLARLVGGRWPANENEQVVVRSGDAKKRTIGDVVPHYTSTLTQSRQTSVK